MACVIGGSTDRARELCSKDCGHSRLAGAQLVVAVDELLEPSIAPGRSHDDFAGTKPGFRSLSTSATDELTNNPKLERTGPS